MEKRCDNFALDKMINNRIWQKILNDYANKEEICKDNNIPLCFMYSRLAYLGKIKYNSKEYLNHKEIIY